MTKPNSQKDYTSFEGSYQVFLPFNLEFQIGKDDPVRLLRHCIGGMDITALERTYQRIERSGKAREVVGAGNEYVFHTAVPHAVQGAGIDSVIFSNTT